MANQEALQSVAPSRERAPRAPLRFEPIPIVVPAVFVPILSIIFASLTGLAIGFKAIPSDAWGRYPHLFVGAWVLASTLCVSLLYKIHQVVSRHIAQRRQRAEQAALDQATVLRAQAEAEMCTRQLRTIFTASMDCASRIPSSVQRARLLVQQAEGAFTTNAYMSFWDRMEDASEVFASLAEDFARLTAWRATYSASLRDRIHTFPQFPVAPSTLVDPSECAARFNALVQRADHSYELASIGAMRHGGRSSASYCRNAGGAAVDVMRAYADFCDRA